MRFTDLLHAGALLAAAAGTVLGGASVAAGITQAEQDIVLFCTVWWLVAATAAVFLRRSGEPTRAVRRLLTDARPLRELPEPRVARTLVYQLWPLALATLVALVGTAAWGPQVAGVAAAFPIVTALQWRLQEDAVRAVEERDGVAYYVKPARPLEPVVLLRGPGLRREVPRGGEEPT